jgi:uncharacterized protein YdhG (YjbR/CyaY superfamily)
MAQSSHKPQNYFISDFAKRIKVANYGSQTGLVQMVAYGQQVHKAGQILG